MVACSSRRLASLLPVSTLVLLASSGCLAPRADRSADTKPPGHSSATSDAQTNALIERVARLELGIRRHRELAEDRDQGMSTELEKILSAIATLANGGVKASDGAKAGLHSAVVYSLPIDGVATEGPATALVTIVVATDFRCALCEGLAETLTQLKKEYGAKLQIAHANHATESGRTAAIVHCLANKAGKGETMRAELWREHRVGMEEGDLDERFEKATLLELARTLRVRKSALSARNIARCEEQLDREHERFERHGVTASPTSFINGRVVIGAQRIEVFRGLIDAELIRAKRVLASGVRVKRYYDLVVASGYEPKN